MNEFAAGMTYIRPPDADDRRLLVVAIPILAVTLAILALFGIKRSFDPDEIEAVRAAWKMLHGQMIYRDFFEHHNPLFYLSLSPLVSILPEKALTMVWLRGANLVLLSANLALTFLIARRVFNIPAAVTAMTLLATTHLATYKMIELRPDNLQMLLGMIGYYLLMRNFDQPRRLTLLLSGIAFGLSFMALQKAVFLVFAITLIVCFRLLQRRFRIRDVFWLLIGFVGSLVPFGIWFAATGTLKLYWLLNFRLNVDQAYAAGPLETMRTDPQVFTVLADSFVSSAILWAFALAATIVAFKPIGVANDSIKLQRELVLICVVLIGWILVLNKYYWQYYSPALPFVAILAAGAMIAALRNQPVVLMCLLLAACFSAYRDSREAFTELHSNGWQLQDMKRTLALTNPGNFVIDTRQNFNLFRPDPLYLGFIHPDKLLPKALAQATGRTEDVLNVIAATHPVMINMNALPTNAWPTDPRLAGYVELSVERTAPIIERQLILNGQNK